MPSTLNKNKNEISSCLLCKDAPCNKACPHNMKPADIIRSLYFDNEAGAADRLRHMACEQCEAPCGLNCVLGKRGEAVKIKQILSGLKEASDTQQDMNRSHTDLSADICGVRLENP